MKQLSAKILKLQLELLAFESLRCRFQGRRYYRRNYTQNILPLSFGGRGDLCLYFLN